MFKQYALQATMNPIVRTHKNPFFSAYLWHNSYNMMVKPPQLQNHEKYDNNGMVWYSRFDDNKMIYNYVLSITESWMVQSNTNNPIYCKFIKMVTDITNYILHLRQNIRNKHLLTPSLYGFNVCGDSCIMLWWGSSILKPTTTII